MIRTYWDILGRYKWSIVVCPVLVLVFVVCETLQPMLMARIVDEGVMHRDIAVVTRIGIWMLGISVAGLLANITNVFVSSNASVGFATELRSRLFRKIQEFSFAEMDKFNSASLITRLTGDVTRLQQVVLLGLRILLRSPMMLVMAFFYVVRIDSGLALIVAGAIPVLGISVYLILRKGFPYFLKMQQKVDAVNAVVRENLINMRVVKSFVRERYESRKFSASNRDLCDVSVKASNIIVTIFPVMQLVLNLSVIVVLWVGGERVAAGRLQVGELVSLVNYLMQILMSLMMLSMVLTMIIMARASAERITEILNEESDLKNGSQPIEEVKDGSVVFENVSFSYAKDPSKECLKNVNLTVKSGETVGILGGTGTSKTTLVQLIPRLYDATEGRVLVGGADVRDYDMDALRDQVAMVLQKNVLFSGTIKDNLRWGKKDATDEEMVRMCQLAQADSFIQEFPDKYDTYIEQGGSNVSGGQKQRLCIARALLKHPKILILDDSTSAVDTKTDALIRKAFLEEIPDTTKFIIAQRVSSIEDADKILVMDGGQIVAMGTHDELLKTCDIYRETYESQMKGGSDNEQ